MLIDCGECNPITTEFYEGIRDYILLNFEAMIAEMVIDVIPGGLITFPLKLAPYGWLLSVEAAIEALPCDYPCFARRAPPIIYVHVAIYYGAEGMLGLIDWYRNSEYIMCPPESAFEQLLTAKIKPHSAENRATPVTTAFATTAPPTGSTIETSSAGPSRRRRETAWCS